MWARVIDNIKEFIFPQKKDELLYCALQKILTFKPHNIELYRQALHHKSILEFDEDGNTINNERLEFLGDAILEAVVSNYLFRNYRNEQEGFLTTLRSKLVRRSTLGLVSKQIGLERLVMKGNIKGSHNSYIGGNAFEALFGAAYLDRGYRCCQKFFISLIERGYIVPDNVEQKVQNFKSDLLEWGQKNRIDVRFESVEIDADSSHNASFLTRVYIEGHMMGRGRGFSKKESHQQAAQYTLQRLRERPRVEMHIKEDHLMNTVVGDVFRSYVKV